MEYPIHNDMPRHDEKWDQRFLDMAKLVASWSKDPSSKVGAVIVDPKNRVVSVGYNGFPRGVKDCKKQLEDRETKYALTLHAETNAILFAQRDLSGCSIYTTHIPCSQCAAKIIQSGISWVASLEPEPAFLERWKTSIDLTTEIFKGSGVKLKLY